METSVPVVWHDVTQELDAAVAQLKVEELACTRSFNMLRTTTAVELMEPRLDSGANKEHVPQIFERLAAGHLNLTPSPEVAAAILDQLEVLEASYLDGNSAPQTVHTCLFMQSDALRLMAHLVNVPWIGAMGPNGTAPCANGTAEPLPAVPQLAPGTAAYTTVLTMLAYCASLLQMMNATHLLVCQADIHKEEDYIANLYGLDMCTHLSVEQLDALLQSAECALDSALSAVNADQAAADVAALVALDKKFKTKKAKKKGVDPVSLCLVPVAHSMTSEETKSEALHSDPAVAGQLAAALLARIRYRRAALAAISLLGLPDTAGIHTATLAASVMQSQLTALDARMAESVDDATRASVAAAFDSKFLRKILLPCVPPFRALLSSSDAHKYMHTFAEHLVHLCGIHASVSPGGNVEEPIHLSKLVDFVYQFSTFHPNVLARSLLMLWVGSTEAVLGRTTFLDMIHNDIVEQGFPAHMLRSASSQDYIAFVHRPVRQYLALGCYALPRQRRSLDNVLHDWAVIQGESDSLDALLSAEFQTNLHEFPHRISYWATDKALRLQQLFVKLGFQLDLYKPDEYVSVYSYLDHIITADIRNTRALLYSEEYAKAAAKAKKRTGKKAAAPTKVKKPEKPTERLLMLEMEQLLSRGLLYLVRSLELCKRVQEPKSSYCNATARYNRRFQVFGSYVVPVYLSYSEFKEMLTAMGSDPSNLLHHAQRFFDVLYQSLVRVCNGEVEIEGTVTDELKAQLRVLMRVGIANKLLAVRLLAAPLSVSDEASGMATFSLESHPIYCTVQVPK